VLIVGSGNIVHNLGRMAFDKMHGDNFGFDWAIEAREKINSYIVEGNHKDLINYRSQGSAIQLAIPSPEHYLPLIYTLALKEKDEAANLFNDKFVAGSLTMTSVKIDKA
jgi:4,5-DOPA dioxygenase extradiol